MTIYDELVARGLIAQVTDEKEIKELINNGKATFYIGFDPTADSLHVGHFMALCLMKRLQMAGNKPIALIGGGTTMIGDPTGKTDMRKMLSKEEIDALAEKVKTEPWKREAQKALAREVTKFVHGEKAVEEAERITKALFSGDVADLTANEIEQGFKNMPSVEVADQKQNIILWLVDDTKIEPSRRQAREDVKNGAIRINGEQITDENAEIDPSTHFDGKFVIVRKGKKRYWLARVKK